MWDGWVKYPILATYKGEHMEKITTIYNGKVADLIEVLEQYKDSEICVCGTNPVVVYRSDDTNTIAIDYDEDLVDISDYELEKYCIQNWNSTMCHTSCKRKHECDKYISKHGRTPLFGKEI